MGIIGDLKGLFKSAEAMEESHLKCNTLEEAVLAKRPIQCQACDEKLCANEDSGQISEDNNAIDQSNAVIDRVFQLRENFVIIGLTGRTGSGCTTVAEKLATKKWSELKSSYKDFNSQPIDNDVRKNRIIDRYLDKHWTQAFDIISASDIIFYYALKEDFDVFANSLASVNIEPDEKSKYEESMPPIDPVLRRELDNLKDRVLS